MSMKYIRQISVVIISLILFAAITIGTCVIFSVRNVNVDYIGYGGEVSENVKAVKSSVLERYRGSLISFVDEDGVKGCIDERYVLTKFVKAYPCTLNLTIKVRRETFAVKDGEFYKIYDEDGGLMFRSETYINSNDNSPDVILEGVDGAADVTVAAGVCKLFTEEFSALRSAVQTARLNKAVSTVDSDKFIFELRCGVLVEISDYKEQTREKIVKAAEVFAGLSGEQKLGGAIYSYVTQDGTVRATYNKNA